IAVSRRDHYQRFERRHSGRALVHHLVDAELHLGRSPDSAAGLGGDPHEPRRNRIGRTAERCLLARAGSRCNRQQQGNHPRARDPHAPQSAETLAASASRRAVHSTALARSPSTTAAGARLTKLSLARRAWSDASCFSSCASSLRSLAHSFSTSTTPPSGTMSWLWSERAACAAAPPSAAVPT